MGHSSMVCSASGLAIVGGTPVRCFLLTRSPYGDADNDHRPWIPRTPPLRATYDGYGSIENIEDLPIAALWLRGLREDLVEKGLGDNTCHDVPTRRDMELNELLDALREGRVEVLRDVENYWRKPSDVPPDTSPGNLSMTAVEKALEGRPFRYIVDEPLPRLVRVRQEGGDRGDGALVLAKDAVEAAGFVAAIAAGSGPYADRAELIVLPRPAEAGSHTFGPDWRGHRAGGQGRLDVSLAMIREDVWQALAQFPRRSWDSKTTPAWPHVRKGEHLWHGLKAAKAGVQAMWELIRADLKKEEKARIDRLREDRKWEELERRRKEHPFFGDYMIHSHVVPSHRDEYGYESGWESGEKTFLENVPGVIGIPAHFSMLLADGREPWDGLLDAVAELAAVRRSLSGVGVVLRPAASSGPQDPHWGEIARHARAMLTIAETEKTKAKAKEEHGDMPATLEEAARKAPPAKKKKKTSEKKAPAKTAKGKPARRRPHA